MHRDLSLWKSALLASVIALDALYAFAGEQPYKMVDQWLVGGQGTWDYLLVDSDAHRLYVAHNARVEVLDTETGKTIGAISGMKNAHGIALAPDRKTGYVSDGAGNAIVVFDPATFATVATIPAGTNPDGIVYEPKTNTVWAFNGRSNNASVLDVGSRQIVATVPLPGRPEFPAVDGRGTMFVNVEDKNEIVRLNSETYKVTAEWSLPGCESPSGLVLDGHGHRLFSVCDGGKMDVTDSVTGKPLATCPIGDSPDAVAFDSKHNLVLSSNGGDGTLSVVDASSAKYRTVETLETKKGARTMAFDPSNGKVYLAYAQFLSASNTGTTATHSRPKSIVPDTFSILVAGR
jgi:DNA-binding beta-propeller fold protein YncE